MGLKWCQVLVVITVVFSLSPHTMFLMNIGAGCCVWRAARGITCNHLQRCSAGTLADGKIRMWSYFRPFWCYVSSHMRSSPSINWPNWTWVSEATLIYTPWRWALDFCSIKLFIHSQLHWLMTSWSCKTSKEIFAYYKTKRYVLKQRHSWSHGAHICLSM